MSGEPSKSAAREARQAGLDRIGARPSYWRMVPWIAGLIVVTGVVVPLVSRSLPVEMPAIASDQIWSTGPLHLAHEDATGGECSVCHASGFQRVPDTTCLNCHNREPHDHATATGFQSAGEERARCATCHAEHEEPESLISSSDLQCRSCHQDQAFPEGHEPFGTWPHVGRTSVVFDHSAHQGKHFSQTGKPFECASCHAIGSDGQRMQTTGYDAMCVDCHGARDSRQPAKVFHHGHQVATAAPVPFVSLPAVDAKVLSQAFPELSAWPAETRRGIRKGVTRLGLTPFAELLIAGEPEVQAALALLRSKRVRLSRLSKASEAQVEAAGRVVLALLHLLAELADDPEAAIGRRLGRLLDAPMSSGVPRALSGALHHKEVERTVHGWLGEAADLLPEVDVTTVAADRPGLTGAKLGRWRDDKYALHYALSGHADDFVRAWLEVGMQLRARGDTPWRTEVLELLDALGEVDAKPGKSTGAGRCAKCHDLQAGPRWQASWRSRSASAAEFRHQSHVGRIQECSTCHTLTDEGYLSLYAGESGSQFAGTTRALCAQCHVESEHAGQSCITCHSYHDAPSMLVRERRFENKFPEGEPIHAGISPE